MASPVTVDGPRNTPLGKITSVVALLTILFSFYLLYIINRNTECLADWNQRNAAASAPRLAAAEQDRKAVDDLITAIANARGLTPQEAQARVNGALDVYVKVREESDEARRKNPPPPPPEQTCG